MQFIHTRKIYSRVSEGMAKEAVICFGKELYTSRIEKVPDPLTATSIALGGSVSTQPHAQTYTIKQFICFRYYLRVDLWLIVFTWRWVGEEIEQQNDEREESKKSR